MTTSEAASAAPVSAGSSKDVAPVYELPWCVVFQSELLVLPKRPADQSLSSAGLKSTGHSSCKIS